VTQPNVTHGSYLPSFSPRAAAGPKGEPRQARSRATRARLLDAAISSLAELGWGPSTVSVVAERAGVTRGAAQHHFPTRGALFTAALEHVFQMREADLRRQVLDIPEAHKGDTSVIVVMIFGLFTGPMFRAALALWNAAASDDELRELVVPLEARLGREEHRVAVDLLGVDESVPGAREIVQATLDLGRGLGLANLLTDDSGRRTRIAKQWARVLEQVLRSDDPNGSASACADAVASLPSP